MSSEPLEVVDLRVEHKPFGIFITSEQIPGLYVWGTDPDVVFADLVPAIQSLYRHNRNLSVDVRPLSWPHRNAAGEVVPHRFQIFESAHAESA